MTAAPLTTTVAGMTMNWYLAESMIAERTRGMAAAEDRRWPELRHARAVRSGRRVPPIRDLTDDLAGTGLAPKRAVARR